MIKVLVSGLTADYGGIETFILNIMKNIDNTIFSFDFILNKGKEATFANKVKNRGGIIHYVTPWGKNPLRHKKDLITIFENNSYDYVWINTSSATIISLAEVTKRYSKSKLIVHSHGTNFETGTFLKRQIVRFLHNINKKKLIKLCDYQFACSIEAGHWLFGDEHIKVKETHIIKNAIESDKYIFSRPIRNELRKQLSVSGDLVLIHVGRMTKVKNHEFLIKIFNEIQNKKKNSRLLLVGDGELESDLRTMVSAIGLSEKVCFLGKRDDVPALLQAADIMILPSISEGLPLTVIEAQAAGLVSFVSDVVSPEANITNLVRFMSIDNPASFWAKVILEYDSNYIREDLSEKIVGSGFDVVKNTKIVEELLIKLR